MAKRLDIKDLNLHYGKFHAVQDVTLQVPARSVTAFIGPSGCGKSTVLRSLNRMHEVIPGARVEGKVMVDGQSLYRMPLGDVLFLLANSAAYFAAGLLIFKFCERIARNRGALGHY